MNELPNIAQLTEWTKGAIAIALWLGLFWPAKRLLFRYVRKKLPIDSLEWGHILIRGLQFPTTLLILAGAVVIAAKSFPIPERFETLLKATPLIFVIFAFVFLVHRLLIGLLSRSERNHFELRNYSGLARGVIHALVIALGLLVVLDTLGISVTPLIASLGVGSIAVALALQDTLASFFSGLSILIDKPIAAGHYIELEGGYRGFVEKVTWRTTRIRMLQNNIIIIPNTKIANSIITNFHRPEGQMAVLVQVGVHYSSDLTHVERVTIEVGKEVMKEVEGGVPEFEPFTRYHTFGDSSINFTVILRGKDFVSQYLITHEFIKRLKNRYDQEGIVIPFPIRTVVMEKTENS